MKKTDVSRLVKQWTPLLIDHYGLQNWAVMVSVGESDKFKGVCEATFKYMEARIYVSYNQANSKEDLWETLCHEFEHILTSPFKDAWLIAEGLLNEEQANIVEEVFALADEYCRSLLGVLRKNKKELKMTP